MAVTTMGRGVRHRARGGRLGDEFLLITADLAACTAAHALTWCTQQRHFVGSPEGDLGPDVGDLLAAFDGVQEGGGEVAPSAIAVASGSSRAQRHMPIRLQAGDATAGFRRVAMADRFRRKYRS
jgi:hypothetical protein